MLNPECAGTPATPQLVEAFGMHYPSDIHLFALFFINFSNFIHRIN